MSSRSMRLPEDWRRFDRTGLIGALLLPTLLGLLWLTGFGPSAYLACGGTPAEVRLTSAAGKITLSGDVIDVGDRNALLEAARQAYGPGNVVDNLKIEGHASRLAWAGNAPGLVRRLRRSGNDVAMTIKGRAATIEGVVDSDVARTDIGSEMTALLGSTAVLKNALVVKAPPKIEPAPAAPPVAPVAPPPKVEAPQMAKGAIGKYRLPDGTEISIVGEGIEHRLLSFITDGGRSVDRSLWFDFDRLQFKTGSTELTPESRAQIETTVAILKAYPQVAVKIGGYTDNVGDADANLKLSQARAERVAAELVGLGIAADRVEAEGYGDRHPIASNDTAEGRALNRRTALSVRQK